VSRVIVVDWAAHTGVPNPCPSENWILEDRAESSQPRLIFPPNHTSLITQKPLSSRAINRRLDRLANRFGDADEAEVAGQSVDDVLAFVDRALSHARAKRLAQLVEAVVGHRSRPSVDERGTVGFDDPSADRRPQVAAEGLVDFGAEALVTH
jgi:hypothetical protein